MRAFRARGILEDKVTFPLDLKVCMGDTMRKRPANPKARGRS